MPGQICQVTLGDRCAYFKASEASCHSAPVFVALAARAAEDIQGEPREEILRVANASALQLLKMWTGGMPTPSQPDGRVLQDSG